MTEMLRNYSGKMKIGAEQSYKNLAMFPLLSGFSTQHNHLTVRESFSSDIIFKNGIDKDRSTPKHTAVCKPNQRGSFVDGESPADLNPLLSVIDTALLFENEAVLIPGISPKKHRSFCIPNQDYRDKYYASSWDYLEQFARVDSQIGAIFLINGKIAGLICFDSPETFEKLFITIVECYARQAVDEFSTNIESKSCKPEVINFLLKWSNPVSRKSPEASAWQGETIGTTCC